MKRYRVIGVLRVLGHDPGDVFEADLDLIQEERLLGSHLQIEPASKPEFDALPEPELDASDESEEGLEAADKAEKEN